MLNFHKPLDVNSGFECKCDLIVKNSFVLFPLTVQRVTLDSTRGTFSDWTGGTPSLLPKPETGPVTQKEFLFKFVMILICL